MVVKRAERGCLVLDARDDAVVEVPADRVRPFDSTGAGDAFCGAFAAADLRGAGAVDAAQAGAAAARVAIGPRLPRPARRGAGPRPRGGAA